MRLIAACVLMTLAGAGAVRAGEHDVAWGRLAGEHMGSAEAGAKCPGYRFNAARRTEIVALYGNEAAGRALEAERVRVLAVREAAMKKDLKGVCAALLDMYGPTGLAIANYLVLSGKPDVTGQVGLDHGLKLGVDPRGMEALHWLRFGGIATAIETVCGSRYEMVPVVQAQIYAAGQLVGQRDAMLTMTAAMAAAGDQYKLKTDRTRFCAEILRDYGPVSDRPLVRHKRAR